MFYTVRCGGGFEEALYRIGSMLQRVDYRPRMKLNSTKQCGSSWLTPAVIVMLISASFDEAESFTGSTKVDVGQS